MGRLYKDYKIYGCIALNRLVAELNIDIYQTDLVSKLDALLAAGAPGLSKEAIKHEIRSNHYMTEKVIQYLMEEGLVETTQAEGRYAVRITKKGVLHLVKFNELYMEIYREHILDHYRYSRPPPWLGVG